MNRSPREFSFGEVATLSGVSARSLDYWATTGFLPPSISEKANPGTGAKRVYSYADILAARVAKYLRSAGLPFKSLRRLVTRFQTEQFGNVGPQGRLFIFGAQAIAVSNQKELAAAIKKADENYPACPVVLPLGRILVDLKTDLDRLPKRPFQSRGRVLQDRGAESDRAQNKQLNLFSGVDQIPKKPAARVRLKETRPDEQKVG